MKSEKRISPFDRGGMWIVRRFPALLCGKQGRKLEKRLQLLRTTRESPSLEEYYGKKFSELLKLACLGSLVLGILALSFSGKVSWMKEAVISRPESGAGDLETELQASVQGGETIAVPVTIGARKLSDQEAEALFAEISVELETCILGENESLQEVRSSLKLPESFANGLVEAKWEVDPPEYMDSTGSFLQEVPQSGVEASLWVTLKYEEKEQIQEIPVCFLPPLKSLEEQQADRLQELVQEANEKNPQEETVSLPESLEGLAVQWGKQNFNPLIPGVFLFLIGLFYIYQKDDRKLEEEEKQRSRQMVLDYPVILYKMSMLLGAGMSIKGAFSRIAFHYRNQESPKIRYAYEEMLLACYEMQNGVGEAAAYEHFGQKCQDMRYLKFGSLLSQNLKKGSEGLAGLLEAEARSGMEERKNLARKLGEEAGTKLLLPMMLMLVLVMVILMVPALISF